MGTRFRLIVITTPRRIMANASHRTGWRARRLALVAGLFVAAGEAAHAPPPGVKQAAPPAKAAKAAEPAKKPAGPPYTIRRDGRIGAPGAGTHAMGVNYAALPAGSMTISKSGATYYLNGNTWFQPAYGTNGVYYRVVAAR
jgi:hypothetical protein